MADLHVTWDDYHRAIERLAAMICDSGWRFNQIVCIARGGLRVGDTLSRIFKLPLAIISTQSYVGEGGSERGALTMAEHMTMTTPTLGDRVLLADDLVDSGVTLDAVQRHLLETYPTIAELRTAVLWYKASSKCAPDYYVHYLPDNPWIHQPFEPYERMVLADLLARRR
ncbi:MAG: phosphoribosyltransferase [candidate division NC10 bacterium RBG_16_65_8]|nr:MAG: phosphoribosyltransferase [candidate division NC10 bacterium RBG_16_65_8]